jgi:hypothetical protein
LERKYENPNEFLQDIKPLLDLLKYIHKNIDLKIFHDLLDLTKPLHEIHALNFQIDGSQRLLSTLNHEIVPSSISRLFQGGQFAGRNAARTPTKISSPNPTTPSVAQPPPLLFTREIQTPPFHCCVSHERYHGVWGNPADDKFVAQVTV